MSFLTWLHEQATAMANTVTALASNSPEPARNTVVYLIALIAVTTTVITILRKIT